MFGSLDKLQTFPLFTEWCIWQFFYVLTIWLKIDEGTDRVLKVAVKINQPEVTVGTAIPHKRVVKRNSYRLFHHSLLLSFLVFSLAYPFLACPQLHVPRTWNRLASHLKSDKFSLFWNVEVTYKARLYKGGNRTRSAGKQKPKSASFRKNSKWLQWYGILWESRQYHCDFYW